MSPVDFKNAHVAMSILRNAHVPMSILRNSYVTMSILRNAPCPMSLSTYNSSYPMSLSLKMAHVAVSNLGV